VLAGDSFAQLLPATDIITDPTVEAERHANLHVGNSDPARIFALDGDVTDPQAASEVDSTKATEIYAGQDVVNLALLVQNNNATDVTSIVAGRDVVYTTQPPPPPTGSISLVQNWGTSPSAIDIGGPGNLLIESGRNVDLGITTGIQSFGNFLDPKLPNEGASITIETGLGSPLVLPDYADFAAQFVNPATDGSNQYAEPLQLFDANGNVIGSGDQAYTYLQTLSPDAQDILLNRVFFDLLRDSGREHNGVTGDTNYELGAASLDTVGALNDAFSNYQRAYAAIPIFLKGTSGSGDFLGGLSTVRTRDGGNITILAPNGQIQVGLVSPPSSFPGYSVAGDATWALNFGIVTQQGGDIDLYANGDISVNQSRVFTLEGGDMTVISKTGNIDAGKGAKTVLSIQPPNIAYDQYGDATITPYGPASGSGLAVLRALPDVPLGNADLIAFVGDVNAGDAGIRVSGNISISAVQVLNAGNISVGGKSSGVPTASVPNFGALSAASSAGGAATQAATAAAQQHNAPPPPAANDLPSIINVQVLGYGGPDDDSADAASTSSDTLISKR
jgi:filamentous hemagglutinin